ncbi:hypothetical protein Hanom_Chr00s057741g01783671 [Helianthus anomalus]
MPRIHPRTHPNRQHPNIHVPQIINFNSNNIQWIRTIQQPYQTITKPFSNLRITVHMKPHQPMSINRHVQPHLSRTPSNSVGFYPTRFVEFG